MQQTKYTIITHHRIDDLIERVNELLKQGWELQGGACITFCGSSDYKYAQALVLKK